MAAYGKRTVVSSVLVSTAVTPTTRRDLIHRSDSPAPLAARGVSVMRVCSQYLLQLLRRRSVQWLPLTTLVDAQGRAHMLGILLTLVQWCRCKVGWQYKWHVCMQWQWCQVVIWNGQSDTDGLTELGHGAGWEVCTTDGLPGFVAIPWLYLINLPGNVYLFAWS